MFAVEPDTGPAPQEILDPVSLIRAGPVSGSTANIGTRSSRTESEKLPLLLWLWLWYDDGTGIAAPSSAVEEPKSRSSEYTGRAEVVTQLGGGRGGDSGAIIVMYDSAGGYISPRIKLTGSSISRAEVVTQLGCENNNWLNQTGVAHEERWTERLCSHCHLPLPVEFRAESQSSWHCGCLPAGRQ
jgi:hypothetical protein